MHSHVFFVHASQLACSSSSINDQTIIDVLPPQREPQIERGSGKGALAKKALLREKSTSKRLHLNLLWELCKNVTGLREGL